MHGKSGVGSQFPRRGRARIAGLCLQHLAESGGGPGQRGFMGEKQRHAAKSLRKTIPAPRA